MITTSYLFTLLIALASAAPSGSEMDANILARGSMSPYYSNGPGSKKGSPSESYWQNNYNPMPLPPPPTEYNCPPPPQPTQDVSVYQIDNIYIQVNIFEIGTQCTPGSYACAHNPKGGTSGWATCNDNGQYEYSCDCPPSSSCGLVSGLSPVCWPF